MMKRPVSTQTNLQWIKNREQQKAEANRRLYSPENCNLFAHTWYVLDEILKFENVLTSFNRLVEMWALPGCQEVAGDYINYLDKHQDCNINSLAIGALNGERKPTAVDDLQAKHDKNSDFDSWVNTYTEFVRESFNTRDNYVDARYKVDPEKEETRLLGLAIMLRSLMSFNGFNIHNLEKYQYSNVDAAMSTEKDTRDKRKLTRIFKHFKMDMVHSETIKKYACYWIGCRVKPGTIEAYLDELSKVLIDTGTYPDRGNIENAIAIYDKAMGYDRKWRK